MTTVFTILFATTVAVPQPDRRPTVAVAAETERVVDLAVHWRSTTDRSGTRYPRYEWEARNQNELLATDTVDDTTTTIRILRPAPPESLVVRVFVRGVATGGPGPWGWASEPTTVRATRTRSIGRVPPEEPPPPDLTGRRGGSHEPDLLRTMVGRSFDTHAQHPTDTGAGSGPFLTGGAEGFDPIEHRYASATVVSDANAPLSPPNVLRIDFATRSEGGRAPALIRTHPDRWRPVTALYTRYAFRVSEGFTVTPASSLAILGYEVNDRSAMRDLVVGVGQGEYQFQADFPVDRPSCQRRRGYPARGPAGMIVPGRWYIVEVLADPGDPEVCNGSLHVWINGRSVIDERAVGFGRPRGEALQFTGVRFEPIWEVTGRRVPRPFSIELDDIYLSGR